MNRITLKSLTLDHFKGQAHLKLAFDGQDAAIYGDNAAGKTTVYDALTWLLFGKDSRGQSGFDIKPLNADGQVKDHGAITSVEAVFETLEGDISLRRTYYEVWKTKRGSAAEAFDGNSSDYFVDGVPSKKYEFERRVGELVSEDVFRLLTGVTYFCADLDWRERRKVLFDVSGVADDGEIMAQAPQFQPLAEAMGRLTLDDYKKKLQTERKGLNTARNNVPVRLDECQKAVRELDGLDFPALRAERDQRAAQRDILSAELLKLDHGQLLDTKRNEHGALHNKLMMLESENAAFRQSQVIPRCDDGAALRQELDILKQSLSRWSNEAAMCAGEKEDCDKEVEACRARWADANAQAFGGGSCPTCGQALTGKLLEEAAGRFAQEKETRLKSIVADADRFKRRSAEIGAKYEALLGHIADAEARISKLEAQLEAVKPTVQPEIADRAGYAEERAALMGQLEALNSEIAALSSESAAIKAETQGKIAALSEEITAIEGTLAKESVLTFTVERMDALRAEARDTAARIEALDKLLYLCDEFTRYKIKFIEDSINSRFHLARFRLFSEQINGGLADCCEATVDGVPYASLNNGARINVGMDVIGALSEHYGVKVPLFVDNAESVTGLLPVDTQVIRLVVSEQDKELRCEYEP